MDSVKKRNFFLAVTLLLVAAIVVVSAAILARGPRESSVEVISRNEDGTMDVSDLNDGRMTIPYYDIPTNNTNPEDFVRQQNGVITYEGGTSLVGINVNVKSGTIDWAQVKEGGVDFAMIRVGYRGVKRGQVGLDENFQTNIQGALDAGIPVGVYFYSKAVTDAEAEEEATFVLEQIRTYKLTFPVAIFWEYDYDSNGNQNQDSRTIQCNGDQVTGFIDTFCKKVQAAGYTPCYYATKSMAYDSLDLSRLSNYDMWYSEYRSQPSFFYNFDMWQYTDEGTVPGITEKVPITLALNKYGS